MSSQKVPKPSDLKSAAQAAVETAQSAVGAAQAVASGAMRIPPASAQLAAQLPDLLENLAIATERYLAMADPMFRTLDRLLPQLESLINTGNDVFRTLTSLPGISTLNRIAGRGQDNRS